MTRRRVALMLLALAGLAACGRKGPLEPPPAATEDDTKTTTQDSAS
jgi:predicted small lipoprotein YifL